MEVQQAEHGWTFGYVHRCGSVWACPACAHQIAIERIWQVVKAVGWWRAQREGNDVVMMTLTVRHRAGENLQAMRRAMAVAWRRLQQTRVWRDMRSECQVRHLVRANDITWSDENGFHPHIHVMLLSACPDAPRMWTPGLTDAWRCEVERAMGADHLPTVRRALTIERCRDASYVARLGLEISSPAAKKAREGHLAPMQLAARLAAARGAERERLSTVWSEYALGMAGCHQLQFSRGLRKALGERPSDAQIVVHHDDRKVVGLIPQETWRHMALKLGVGALDGEGRKLARAPIEAQRTWLREWFADLMEQPCQWEREPDEPPRLRWLVCQ